MVRGRGIVAGVLAAAAVVALRQSDVLRGWPAGLLALVLVLAVPTSRSFARRILLSGLLIFGWVPLMWWVRLPLGSFGRVTILLALLAGGLSGWVLGGDVRARLRALVPDWRALDALPIAGAGIALLQVGSVFAVNAPQRALAHLMYGWDGAPHFAMTYMLRRLGVTFEAAGAAPDGSAWYPRGYPMGFHSASATLMELTSGPHVGSVQEELVRYLHVQPVIYACSVAMVLAGLAGLPWLQRRRGTAVIVASFVGAFFYAGLGASYVANSNLNFVLALALGIAAVELALVVPRAVAPLPLAAVLGGLVGVANGWSMLVLLFVPAAVLLLLPARGARFRVRRAERPWLAPVLLATLVGAIHSASVLLLVDSSAFLSIPGYTPTFDPRLVLLLAGAALAVPLSLGRGRRLGEVLTGLSARRFALFLPTAMGLSVAGLVAVLELRQGTGLQYYFWKTFTGTGLVSAVLGAVSVSGHPRTWRILAGLEARTSHVARWIRLAGVAVVALLLTQLFGPFNPAAGTVRTAWVSSGTRLAADSRTSTPAQLVLAQHLFTALDVQSANPGQIVVFLAIPPSDLANVAWAELWYRGMAADLTMHTQTVARVPTINLDGPATAGLVAHYLFQHENVMVVVDPAIVEAVRGTLPADKRARVVSW